MNGWPELHYPAWRETCAALHLWVQILGKYRLAQTPWLNHSWHATLYVTPRGLSTGPVPDGGRSITLGLDFCEHCFTAEADGGGAARFALEPMSVAAFFERAKAAIAEVGGAPVMNGRPNEIPDAAPFAEDHKSRPYDAAAVERFHQALLRVDAVFRHFRTGFIGKASPVHLFWGGLDLAVTRFSGRRAPLHPGGIPNLPDAVTREAYSHEAASAGFWPGGSGAEDAMFYAYSYPEPAGFRNWPVEPAAARYDPGLREFLLAYDVVRSSDDPEATLLRFLQTTYEAAAETGGWDRAALECDLGRPRLPRAL